MTSTAKSAREIIRNAMPPTGNGDYWTDAIIANLRLAGLQIVAAPAVGEASGADAMDDETLIARLREPSTLQVYCHQAADRLLSLREENARYAAALRSIACYDDAGASARLANTGSYSMFDEPGSVRIARVALTPPQRDK